jgi:hypothetical protein
MIAGERSIPQETKVIAKMPRRVNCAQLLTDPVDDVPVRNQHAGRKVQIHASPPPMTPDAASVCIIFELPHGCMNNAMTARLSGSASGRASGE